MRIPTEKDFLKLNEWGIISNPFAAVEDYSGEKAELRWENDYHCEAYEAYSQKRKSGESAISQEEYRSMERPIDRRKWEYLKRRKAWFICPLGWGKFASPRTTRILDIGCGDGDVTQRIADFINSAWQRAGFGGVPIEIVGVDLNQSRIENAKKLTESPHPDITLSFEVGDVTDGLQFNDEYFDYVVVTGVFEALDDLLFQTFMQEIKRLAWGGVYVHEPIESPGGYPRPDIADEFTSAGFSVERYEKVFKEPFTETGTNDPLEIWPNLINQVLFATKDENQPFENRW